MELTDEIKSKLKKAFKATLKGYIEYKNTDDWANSKGYIDEKNIDIMVFWLIDKTKMIY